MKALTISQPFASLIADGDKWIENRIWSTGYRGPLAIHAGKGTQYLDHAELREYPTGGIIAVATLIACHHKTTICRNAAMEWANVAVSSTGRSWREYREHAHLEGPFCWLLSSVVKFELVPCKGAQGLWTVPTSVGLVICDRLARARVPEPARKM